MIRANQDDKILVEAGLKSKQTSLANKEITNFQLLPEVTLSPVIQGQPINNFSQTTWLEGTPQRYQDKRALYLNNRISMEVGTSFSISAIGSNPARSNTEDGLTYLWKKNGLIIQDQQFQNTNTLIIENAKESDSGIYVCDVENEYGVTSTDSITIRVSDIDTSEIFTKTLVTDGSGDANLEEWTTDSDKISSLEFLDFFTTRGNASITRNGFFRFSNDRRLDNNSTIIPNENPGSLYASFFPSPKSIEENSTFPIQNNISDFYIGLSPYEYENPTTYKLRQEINLNQYIDYIDGASYGSEESGYQLFHYIGAGISTFDPVFNDSYVVSNGIFPSNQNFSEEITSLQFVPSIADTVRGLVEFKDAEGNILSRDLFNGPDQSDLVAVLDSSSFQDIDSKLQIVPTRKINFVNLGNDLFTEDGKINRAQEYYISPFFRVPSFGSTPIEFTFPGGEQDVTDTAVTPAIGEGLGIDVFTIPPTIKPPTANYEFSFVTELNALRDFPIKIYALKSNTDFNDTQLEDDAVLRLKQRLFALDVILDILSYDHDLDNLPASIGSNDQQAVLLAMYFTLLGTTQSHLSDYEKQTLNIGRIERASKELLRFMRENQRSSGGQSAFIDVAKDILANYTELKANSIATIQANLLTQVRSTNLTPPEIIQLVEGFYKESCELIWEDLIFLVNVLSNDFRFRKLTTIINSYIGSSLKSVIVDSLQDILPLTNQDISSGNKGRALDSAATNLIEQLYPRITFNTRQQVFADYFKIIKADTKEEDLIQVPYNINPQTQEVSLFVNSTEPESYRTMFSKGASAFFAYSLTGSIPQNARTAGIEYQFKTSINDIAKSQPDGWQSSRLTLDFYSEYGSARAGIAGSTFLVKPYKYNSQTFEPQIKLPENNVWYQRKRTAQLESSDNLINSIKEKINTFAKGGLMDAEDLNLTALIRSLGNINGNVFFDDNFSVGDVPLFADADRESLQSDNFEKSYIRGLFRRYEGLKDLSF